MGYTVGGIGEVCMGSFGELVAVNMGKRYGLDELGLGSISVGTIDVDLSVHSCN